jgi:hypothetical protein
MTKIDELGAIEKRVLAQVVAERVGRELDALYLRELIDLRAKFAVQLRPVAEERDRLVLEAVGALRAAKDGLPSTTPFAYDDEDPEGPTRRRVARAAALKKAEKSFVEARDRAIGRFTSAAAKLNAELEAAEAELGSHFASLSARAARGAA